MISGNASFVEGDDKEVVSHVEPDGFRILLQKYRVLLSKEDLELEKADRLNGPALQSALDSSEPWGSYNQWLCFSSQQVSVDVVETTYDDKIEQVPVLYASLPRYQFEITISSEIDNPDRVVDKWRDLLDETSNICAYAAFLQNLGSRSLWIISKLKSEKGVWEESGSTTADVSVGERQIGPYQILITRVDDGIAGRIEIRKDGEIVFEEEEIGSYFYFGSNFEPNENIEDLSGADFTGDGTPNLLISKWTGGAHCCNFLYIFELGENFKKIVTVKSDSYNITLSDLDQDNIPEIQFWEGAIDYLFASFAHSSPGRVVLKFTDGNYQISHEHMRAPLPSADILSEKKVSIRAAFEQNESSGLPYEFLELMMSLSYTGHLNEALGMADEVWPQRKPGLDKFKLDFKEALRSSDYWLELSRL